MRSCPSTDLISVSQYNHHVIWALFTGRGPPADSSMVPLHPVLLQQPGRMEKTSTSPGQYHDQRNGEKWRNWQGIQSAELSWPGASGCYNSLERKMIRENWGVTVTWVLPCSVFCLCCLTSHCETFSCPPMFLSQNGILQISIKSFYSPLLKFSRQVAKNNDNEIWLLAPDCH